MKQFFRKNISSLILLAMIIVLFFSPAAKAMLLKTLLHTGIFNANTEKEKNRTAAVTPRLVFADQQGQVMNTSNLQGKVVFINFWASWCPPCIAEMGSINALYQQLKTDPRFVFIMADADGRLPAAQAFMLQHGYELPVYTAIAVAPEDLYNGTLPTTLIIDAGGRLVQKHEGIANYDTKEMRVFLQSLLPEKTP